MALRIGFLTPEYPTSANPEGGLANYVRKIASLLAARNHEVTVFAFSQQNGQWQDGRVNILEIKRSSRERLPVLDNFKLVWNQYDSSRRMELAVKDYLKSKSLDVIQTSSYMTPALTLTKNGTIPVICRISSYTPLLRSAHGFKLSFPESVRDKMEIRQLRNSDAVFSPSEFMARTVEPFLHSRPAVIRSPFDTTEVKIDESVYGKKFEHIPYFLFFGNLTPIKGTDLLASAIPQVARLHPEIHFVLIGRDDGDATGRKIMDLLSDRCREFTQNIHYFRPLPRSQLYPFISHAIAVLMPSRVDNYPNACLEAQFLGTPVIGSYNSSLEEMIESGETGLLIENNNSAGLAQAMLQILGMKQNEISCMKEKIKNKIQTILQEDRVGELEKFYDQTIQSTLRK